MKTNFSSIGLASLCGWFGITRQAYYQNRWVGVGTSISEDILLQEVQRIRQDHKRMGARKLHHKLTPFMSEHQIKMGRDALFDLLSSNNLLVRKRKRRVQTTQSHHWLRKYPNLVRGFVPTVPDQLWVSDITYWKINGSHVYISFITDAFSHKVVGYHLAQTLETVETIQALQMAISGLLEGPGGHSNPIHHSDRGVQYCSHGYVKLLKDNGMKISMTENGDPLENAVAERLNGILKDEYLYENPVRTVEDARLVLSRSVRLYNDDRPHMSIGNHCPGHVHEKGLKTGKLWKNYYKGKTTTVNQSSD